MRESKMDPALNSATRRGTSMATLKPNLKRYVKRTNGDCRTFFLRTNGGGGGGCRTNGARVRWNQQQWHNGSVSVQLVSADCSKLGPSTTGTRGHIIGAPKDKPVANHHHRVCNICNAYERSNARCARVKGQGPNKQQQQQQQQYKLCRFAWTQFRRF